MKNPDEPSAPENVEQNRTIIVENDRFPGKLAISAVQANSNGHASSTETLRLTRDEAVALHMLLGRRLFGAEKQ